MKFTGLMQQQFSFFTSLHLKMTGRNLLTWSLVLEKSGEYIKCSQNYACPITYNNRPPSFVCSPAQLFYEKCSWLKWKYPFLRFSLALHEWGGESENWAIYIHTHEGRMRLYIVLVYTGTIAMFSHDPITLREVLVVTWHIGTSCQDFNCVVEVNTWSCTALCMS